jgi:D-alanyl-D-alanine carboxypeptidase
VTYAALVALSSKDLRTLTRRLHALGIRRVTGSVVGDESYFDNRRTAPSWKASFYLDESPPALRARRRPLHDENRAGPAARPRRGAALPPLFSAPASACRAG